MASNYSIDGPAVALAAGTPKTVLLATAAAAAPFKLVEISVGCDASAAGSLKVEYLVGTITGGTAGTAPNIGRGNSDAYSRTPTTTATGGYSAEPTYTKHTSNGALAVKTFVIPLPATPYDIEYPLGREWYCPAANVFAVRLTAVTVSPNAYVTLNIEEG